MMDSLQHKWMHHVSYVIVPGCVAGVSGSLLAFVTMGTSLKNRERDRIPLHTHVTFCLPDYKNSYIYSPFSFVLNLEGMKPNYNHIRRHMVK